MHLEAMGGKHQGCFQRMNNGTINNPTSRPHGDCVMTKPMLPMITIKMALDMIRPERLRWKFRL